MMDNLSEFSSTLKKVIPEPIKEVYRIIRRRWQMLHFESLPSTIGFEMTTECNAKCIMCARRDTGHIIPRHMDFKILEKVLDEVSNYGREKTLFNLTGLCEPLLYPRIIESVVYIKRRLPLSDVKIITNGIALTKEISFELIQGGLDIISISVNAGSRESYRWLTDVDKYEQVVANIMTLLDLRKEMKKSLPAINLNFKITDRTREEIKDAMKFWTKFMLPTDYLNASVILSNYRESIDIREIDSHYTPPTERWPCLLLWGGIKLDIDGNIYPCDGKIMNYNYRSKSELLLGNIFKNSIQEVYTEDKLNTLRKLHLYACYEKLPTCHGCESWRWYKNVWLKNCFPIFTKRKWL